MRNIQYPMLDDQIMQLLVTSNAIYATKSDLDTKIATVNAAVATKASSVHTHTKADVGLSNVDNTSDSGKPISTATQSALNAKASTIELSEAVGVKLDKSEYTSDMSALGTVINNKASSSHVHTIASLPGLQEILDDKVSKTERFPFSLSISATKNRYLLTATGLAGYTPGKSDVVLTINSGVSLYSDDVTLPALDIDNTWNVADTIKIVNKGTIIGSGGKGGATGGTSGGTKGGDAVRTLVPITIDNIGTLAGGGGGGGAGGGAYWTDGYTVGGGGGGGQGYIGGAAGSINGTGTGPYAYYRAPAAGTAGTSSGAGTGGAGAYGHAGYVSPATYFTGGTGGNGGLLGMPGGNGGPASYSQEGGGNGPLAEAGGAAKGLGGAAGSYIVGNSKVTWLSTGTRKGNVN